MRILKINKYEIYIYIYIIRFITLLFGDPKINLFFIVIKKLRSDISKSVTIYDTI